MRFDDEGFFIFTGAQVTSFSVQLAFFCFVVLFQGLEGALES